MLRISGRACSVLSFFKCRRSVSRRNVHSPSQKWSSQTLDIPSTAGADAGERRFVAEWEGGKKNAIRC